MEGKFELRYETKHKGDTVKVFYEKGGELPWSVQFRGCGKYFKTLNKMLEYCHERKFRVSEKDVLKG